MQGSIIDGINAAWRQELDIRKGRVVQSNFHEYTMLRIPDAPRQIEIHFVKTDNPPTKASANPRSRRLRRPCATRSSPATGKAGSAAARLRDNADLSWA